MDFLNDIKVYDDVIDTETLESINRYLTSSFYSLSRSNNPKRLEDAKEFLRVERSSEEMDEFKKRTYKTILVDTDVVAADCYFTRIHKGGSDCTKEDEELCVVLYELMTKVIKSPPYANLGNVYTNMLRSMDRPKAHIDNIDAKNRTVMFYTNTNWERDWGGETIFYDLDDNIIKAVSPKPGRMISFDGRIPHSARPPMSSACIPRYITVMKF